MAALVLMVARGFCNVLDGVMAIEVGAATRVGALYNEVPDRISDAAVLVGAGYAIGGVPVLGWAAALGAVFTAYVRVQAQVAGASADYRGFFGKPGRMICSQRNPAVQCNGKYLRRRLRRFIDRHFVGRFHPQSRPAPNYP